MQFLADLWLPILLAAVIVFFASSILHMVLPFHKKDVKRLSNQDDVLATMRADMPARGTYIFPCPEDMKSYNTPELIESWKQGPVGFLTILPPGPPAMHKALGIWFALALGVSMFIAYITWHAFTTAPDPAFFEIFRIAAATGFLAFATGPIAESTWKGQPWSTTVKFLIDALIYGCIIGAVFAWLWPDATPVIITS